MKTISGSGRYLTLPTADPAVMLRPSFTSCFQPALCQHTLRAALSCFASLFFVFSYRIHNRSGAANRSRPETDIWSHSDRPRRKLLRFWWDKHISEEMWGRERACAAVSLALNNRHRRGKKKQKRGPGIFLVCSVPLSQLLIYMAWTESVETLTFLFPTVSLPSADGCWIKRGIAHLAFHVKPRLPQQCDEDLAGNVKKRRPRRSDVKQSRDVCAGTFY